jgi:hypothetical protein
MTDKKDTPPPDAPDGDDPGIAGEDPHLDGVLDRATAQYEGKVPPEMLKTMRSLLGDALTTHPVASRYLERTRGQPIVQRSGTRTKDGEAVEEEEDPAKKGSAS